MNEWSGEEDKILIQFYPLIGSNVIYMLPGRSRQSIRKRANMLSLKAKMGRNPSVRWEPEEDALVRDFYPTHGDQIANYLPRKTPKAVTARARQIGVLIGHAIKTSQETTCQS